MWVAKFRTCNSNKRKKVILRQVSEKEGKPIRLQYATVMTLWGKS